MKVRIQKHIIEQYGENTLEEIKAGKRKIFLNDKQVPIDDHFRDKRVTETTKVEIRPPVLTKVEKSTSDKRLSEKITTKSQTKDELSSQKRAKKPAEPATPAKIYMLKDYLSTEQIVSIRAGKSNVFVDGLVVKDIDTFVLEPSPDDAKPMLNGNKVLIKVLPKFNGGSNERHRRRIINSR